MKKLLTITLITIVSAFTASAQKTAAVHKQKQNASISQNQTEKVDAYVREQMSARI